MKLFGAILTLCGLCIVIYGLLLFFAMPAAGAFVVVAGLVCIALGVKRQEQGTKKEKKKEDKRSIKEAFRDKSYKVAANIFFVTNFILIGSFIPKFYNSLSDEVGFVVSGLLMFAITTFYTAIILSLFRTTVGVALVIITTWAGLWMKAMH